MQSGSRRVAKVVEALRAGGVTVHRVGSEPSRPGLTTTARATVLVVGPYEAEVVVEPPDTEGGAWRLVVPTRVQIRVGDADPAAATRLHDAALAPTLRAAGFAPSVVDTSDHTHTARWHRTAATDLEVARLVAWISAVESRIEPAPDDGFWESFGDVRGVAERLVDLPPSMVATITPWGATIALDERYRFATLQEQGGYVHVAVLLPQGHCARAARRRADRILRWFTEQEAPAWRGRGFGEPHLDGEEQILRHGMRRWAVRIRIPLPRDTSEVAGLAWAADHDTIEAPPDPILCSI